MLDAATLRHAAYVIDAATMPIISCRFDADICRALLCHDAAMLLMLPCFCYAVDAADADAAYAYAALRIRLRYADAADCLLFYDNMLHAAAAAIIADVAATLMPHYALLPLAADAFSLSLHFICRRR